ncbi:MAG: helix-turn-helix transcriptional regulator [Thermodesulfobacteriota bacterium]
MNTGTLVTRLERLQLNRGFSSRVLGRKIGVGKSTINDWFSGESTISPRSAVKVNRFLKRLK